MKTSFHFIITGEYFTKKVIDTYWGLGEMNEDVMGGIVSGSNHEKAFKILSYVKPKLKKKKKKKRKRKRRKKNQEKI